MKQSEVQQLSLRDLQGKEVELKKRYQDLKMKHLITPLENPIQLRMVRRSIARVITEIVNKKNNS